MRSVLVLRNMILFALIVTEGILPGTIVRFSSRGLSNATRLGSMPMILSVAVSSIENTLMLIFSTLTPPHLGIRT
ncbi:hypothetical protein BJ878DRAFT_502392 [Calycina marina]|uniref:Uncharacterized protein n=1 Tax=Calycina marina TaxID=1763456 RepID=A0A9P8CFW1_9HELO|nr:hypothetical protein BJ878DRAFT_502392 [Calycina marina]